MPLSAWSSSWARCTRPALKSIQVRCYAHTLTQVHVEREVRERQSVARRRKTQITLGSMCIQIYAGHAWVSIYSHTNKRRTPATQPHTEQHKTFWVQVCEKTTAPSSSRCFYGNEPVTRVEVFDCQITVRQQSRQTEINTCNCWTDNLHCLPKLPLSRLSVWIIGAVIETTAGPQVQMDVSVVMVIL